MAPSPKESSKFLTLPPEIRVNIYQKVFSNLENEEIAIFDCPSDKAAQSEELKYRIFPHDFIPRYYNPALLSVNRQIYYEAHRLFYSIPVFKILFSCLGPDEPTILRRISLRDLRHISVRDTWLDKLTDLVAKGEFHRLKTVIVRSIFVCFYSYSGALSLWPDMSIQETYGGENQEEGENEIEKPVRSITFGALNQDLIKSYITGRESLPEAISVSKPIDAYDVRLGHLRQALSDIGNLPSIEIYVKVYIQDWSRESPLSEGQILLHHHKHCQFMVEGTSTPSIAVGFYHIGKDALVVTNRALPWS